MKKLAIIPALFPLLASAHDSVNTSTAVHALEHNLNNPFFALSLLLGLAMLTQVVRKVFKR